MRDVGAGLLLVAAILWVWCGGLLTTSYDVMPDTLYARECEARLFTDEGTANEGKLEDPCANERDWPEALLLLGLSVPVSLAGAVLIVYGGVSTRMGKLDAELTSLYARLSKQTSELSGLRALVEGEKAPAGEQREAGATPEDDA